MPYRTVHRLTHPLHGAGCPNCMVFGLSTSQWPSVIRLVHSFEWMITSQPVFSIDTRDILRGPLNIAGTHGSVPRISAYLVRLPRASYPWVGRLYGISPRSVRYRTVGRQPGNYRGLNLQPPTRRGQLVPPIHSSFCIDVCVDV